MADRDLPNCCERGNQAWPDPCPMSGDDEGGWVESQPMPPEWNGNPPIVSFDPPNRTFSPDLGRVRWALKAARHARPKTFAARLRLLWHDFVLHGLFGPGGERCQDCGYAYPLWHANNEDWQRVMGPGGLLCPSCFLARGGKAAFRG